MATLREWIRRLWRTLSGNNREAEMEEELRTPRELLTYVLKEGARIVTVGLIAGAAFSYALALAASFYLGTAPMPEVLPALGAAVVLIAAAVIASLIPAARASRVDVLQALRSE